MLVLRRRLSRSAPRRTGKQLRLRPKPAGKQLTLGPKYCGKQQRLRPKPAGKQLTLGPKYCGKQQRLRPKPAGKRLMLGPRPNGKRWRLASRQSVRGLRLVSRRYRRRLSLQPRLCGRPRRWELSRTGKTDSSMWTLSHPSWSLWMVWMDSSSHLGGTSRPCFVTPWCTDRPPCSPAMVGERRCSGETVEGSLRTQFWFTADENFVVDAEGNRDTYTTIDAATIIKWRCGELVRAVSYHEQESKLLVLMDGVPVIQTSRTYKRVTMSANGSLVSSERSETTSVPAPVVPDPSADGAADASGPTDPPGADASAAAAADDTQSSAQGSEDSCLLPEAREVPSLFNFFQSRTLEDFSTKLTALRQAFTILLSDDQQCNYASVAVRMILRNLATLNGRDADLFQRAFDDLVAYVQNPENALSIQVELLKARIHHINVLDIVFELVLFGMLDVARPQLVPRVQGGFLDQLLAVVHAFLPFEACSPAAHQYWQMLQADLRAFLEEVFSLDLSVYSRLQALADGLFSCLEHRVDQLLSTLPSP
ncbi:uncharacterized protein LOC143122632 [Alosa pseudoharengus]|uniref:uncharacterized protein LOC143122632 n=1 Tax=Alosa pseudoharengus TaxID=34774 RepID=UPI003F8B852C